MDSEIVNLFLRHRLRTTRPRKIVFETLKNATRPLSVVEVVKDTPDIDKVSVYRTIDLFINLGIVTNVAHGWKQRYELASPFRPHHHHLLCTKCGRIDEIHSQKLEQIVHLLARHRTFQVTGHIFEITGLCRACQSH